MPHAIVKMMAGRSDEQKRKLAEAVTAAIVETAGVGEDAVSVAIEDIGPGEWIEKVYEPDIRGKPDTVFKQPGYKP